jgi:hypothetical protein
MVGVGLGEPGRETVRPAEGLARGADEDAPVGAMDVAGGRGQRGQRRWLAVGGRGRGDDDGEEEKLAHGGGVQI